MKIWKELFILVVAFGLIWIVFTYQSVELPETNLQISNEREAELSELIMDNLKSQYDFLDDSISEILLAPITQRLTDTLNSEKYDYTFHLIENHEINAFATIDGHIYVFSGLLKFVDSPEQLAGVIAHEIGHHENGDLVDRLIKELGLNVLLAVMTGGDAIMVSEISKLLISSGFDRKQEREADEFAYDLMAKARINPAQLAHFFTKLKMEAKTYPDDLEMIMTHPNSKNRIEGALTFPLPEGFQELTLDLNWSQLVEDHL